MGLFGKLFEKKICDVCGGEIGLLGNRKLEDGNLCKNCAAKLSPWFTERRKSTVEDIKAQLEYREANNEAVKNFKTTRSIGDYTKVGRIPGKQVDVCLFSRGKVVEAAHSAAEFQESFAEVRADEARPARDQKQGVRRKRYVLIAH